MSKKDLIPKSHSEDINKSGFPTVINNLVSRPVDMETNILSEYDQNALPFLIYLRAHTKDLDINSPIDIPLPDMNNLDEEPRHSIHIYKKESAIYSGTLYGEMGRLMEFKDQTLPIIASMIASKMESFKIEKPDTNLPQQVTVEIDEEPVVEEVVKNNKGIRLHICPEGHVDIEILKSLQKDGNMKSILELYEEINKAEKEEMKNGQTEEDSNSVDPDEKQGEDLEPGPIDKEGHEYIKTTKHSGGKQHWFKDPKSGKIVEKENAPEGHSDYDHSPAIEEIAQQVSDLVDEVAKLKKEKVDSKKEDKKGVEKRKESLKNGEEEKVEDREPKKEEKLEGGRADREKDSKYNPKQLEMGIKHEMEHTDDPKKAKEIAKDHLEENSKYYTDLKKIEKSLKEKYPELTDDKINELVKASRLKKCELMEDKQQGDRGDEEVLEKDDKKKKKEKSSKVEEIEKSGKSKEQFMSDNSNLSQSSHEAAIKKIEKYLQENSAAFTLEQIKEHQDTVAWHKECMKIKENTALVNVEQNKENKVEEIEKGRGKDLKPRKKKTINSLHSFTHKDKDGKKIRDKVVVPVSVEHDEKGIITSHEKPSIEEVSKRVGKEVDTLEHPELVGKDVKLYSKIKKSRLQRMWKVFNIDMPEELNTKDDIKDAFNGSKILKSKITNQSKDDYKAENIVRNTLKEKYGELYKSIIDFKEDIQSPKKKQYIEEIEKSQKRDPFTPNENVPIDSPSHMRELKKMDSDVRFSQNEYVEQKEELTQEVSSGINDRVIKSCRGDNSLDFSDKGFKQFDENEVKKMYNKENEHLTKNIEVTSKNWELPKYEEKEEELVQKSETNINEECKDLLETTPKKEIDFGDEFKTFNEEEIKKSLNGPKKKWEQERDEIVKSNWKEDDDRTEKLEKAKSHKYIKRTGNPGKYVYWYKDAKSGKLVAGDYTQAKKEKEDFDKIKNETEAVKHFIATYGADIRELAKVDPKFELVLQQDDGGDYYVASPKIFEDKEDYEGLDKIGSKLYFTMEMDDEGDYYVDSTKHYLPQEISRYRKWFDVDSEIEKLGVNVEPYSR